MRRAISSIKLYHISPITIIPLVANEQEIQEIDDGQSQVLLVGHNPGIADLARTLAGRGERASLRRLARFPTAASAVCEFDLEHWRDLAPGSGRLLAYTTPKDLV